MQQMYMRGKKMTQMSLLFDSTLENMLVTFVLYIWTCGMVVVEK